MTTMSNAPAANAAPPLQPQGSRHYMTFRLGAELFAVDVFSVREVLDLLPITRVPTAPAYMRGVVNVRGRAVPVVSLRAKFGLPDAADTVHTRIIVLELVLDGEPCVLGGLADSVHEVIELESGQIEPPPRLAARWQTDLILGMARRGDDFAIVLDMNRVFAADELLAVVTAEAGADAAPEPAAEPAIAP
jgi:purine-binding chemotaxis protein CheW